MIKMIVEFQGMNVLQMLVCLFFCLHNILKEVEHKIANADYNQKILRILWLLLGEYHIQIISLL